jgi:hypothetical protein
LDRLKQLQLSPSSESPEPANTAVLLGAPDIDVQLVQLLEREFPREHVAQWVRIRWSLRTVDDLYRRIKADEVEEVDWLHEDEKTVLRRLCGIH